MKPRRACGIVVKVHAALLPGKRLGGGVGVEREMKIIVPLIGQTNCARCAGLRVISHGADLVAGEISEASPEYRQAARIAAGFPQIPFPDGWKANLRGVDLNLNYPASWELAKQIKAGLGFDRPAPRDYPGTKPLDQRETAALAAYTACVRPDILLAYHAQGRVIYPGYRDIDPPGARELAAKFSGASGYAIEEVPPESGNAGFKDWFLQRFHRPGFTIEAGFGENPLPLSQLPQLIRENEPLLAAALAD